MMQAAGTGIQGNRISLISKSEIRYEGTLYSINAEENTIALQSVRMMGTEGRKAAEGGPEIPPGDQVYEFIVFRGSDIKDLSVYGPPRGGPQAPAHPPPPQQDPAILTAWQTMPERGGMPPMPMPPSMPMGGHHQSHGYGGGGHEGYRPMGGRGGGGG
eukprot:RCo029143